LEHKILPYNHKRSKEKYAERQKKAANHNLLTQQRQTVKKYIHQTAYFDRLISEIVCTQTPQQIDNFLCSTLTSETPQIYYPLNEGWQDGLVLANQLQYEFIINAPSQTRHTDLEQLTPIDRYHMEPITSNVQIGNKISVTVSQ
jgi:IS30 family transposase